jgi:hypothetical protein
MKWKAAHAVRARRLHRQGGRTWPDYCEATFGESESEVNRRIQQWPLLKAITEQQARPRAIPDSHVQQLLPMVEQHGQDVTARAYVALRVWAAERRHRVTADVVDGLVELARAAEPPALTSNTFQLAIEAKPKPKPKRPTKKELAPAEAQTGPADSRPTPPTPDAQEQGETHRRVTQIWVTLKEARRARPSADGDEPVVDAEIVDDAPPQGQRTRDLLQGMLVGIEAAHCEAPPPETLKEISAAAPGPSRTRSRRSSRIGRAPGNAEGESPKFG